MSDVMVAAATVSLAYYYQLRLSLNAAGAARTFHFITHQSTAHESAKRGSAA